MKPTAKPKVASRLTPFRARISLFSLFGVLETWLIFPEYRVEETHLSASGGLIAGWNLFSVIFRCFAYLTNIRGFPKFIVKPFNAVQSLSYQYSPS